MMIDDRRLMALYDPKQQPSEEGRPRIVDLFCGTGGFSQGAHAAGFDVIAAYDRDPILTSSFSLNFPNTPLHLRNIAWLSSARIIRDAVQDIDGIIGGPPCQGFSEIGRRDSGDPRRSLLGHYFRLVQQVKPKFFVMENVRGLSFAQAKPVLERGLDLVRDSYDLFGPIVWDASSFGAPTTRPRLFVFGVRRDLRRPLRIEDFTPQMKPAATVAEAIEDLELARKVGVDELGFDRWKTTRPRKPSSYARRLRRAGYFTGHKPTAHSDNTAKRFAEVAEGGFDKVGRHPRLAWNGVCPTLRAGTGSDRGSYQSVRPLHPEEHRVITVREAARLQGFPDDHRFHSTIWHSFRMIGNSVSPIVAQAVLTAIRQRLFGQEADHASSSEDVLG